MMDDELQDRLFARFKREFPKETHAQWVTRVIRAEEAIAKWLEIQALGPERPPGKGFAEPK